MKRLKPRGGNEMKPVVTVLMIASGIALILAAMMGFNIGPGNILAISGRGFLDLSIACSLFVIAVHLAKPFGNGGGSE